MLLNAIIFSIHTCQATSPCWRRLRNNVKVRRHGHQTLRRRRRLCIGPRGLITLACESRGSEEAEAPNSNNKTSRLASGRRVCVSKQAAAWWRILLGQVLEVKRFLACRRGDGHSRPIGRHRLLGDSRTLRETESCVLIPIANTFSRAFSAALMLPSNDDDARLEHDDVALATEQVCAALFRAL